MRPTSHFAHVDLVATPLFSSCPPALASGTVRGWSRAVSPAATSPEPGAEAARAGRAAPPAGHALDSVRLRHLPRGRPGKCIAHIIQLLCSMLRVACLETCIRSLFGHRFILFSPTRTCCYELGGDMARPWSQVSLTSPAPVHVLWFYRELR